jgi:hypothetical protein
MEYRARILRVHYSMPRSVLVLAVVCLAVGGCSVVKAVKTAAHRLEGNKATVDAFTGKLQAGEATAFEATYVTSGSSPATVVYADKPPKDLLFSDTGANGSTSLDVIANASGEYSCSSSAAGSTPSCEKLDAAGVSANNQLLDLYTPAHWISFLKGGSLVAGLAGDRVSSSTMTVNGFDMQCVDLVAPGVPGTSTICSTSQGILGYVKVASVSTSFTIKSYSASPSDSLFQLPPGAKVTTLTTPTTATG